MMLWLLLLAVLVHMPSFIVGCDYLQYKDWAVKQIEILGRNFRVPCHALSGGNVEHRDKFNASVKLFIFQQDESELFPDWLQYHGYLFGLENIHIIDHLSKDPNMCKLLALYNTCGANVTIHTGPFSSKHRTLTRVMRDTGPDTFLIPLDVDEFIALPTLHNNGSMKTVKFETTAIHNSIEQLPVDGRKYKFAADHPIKYDVTHCEKLQHTNHTRRALEGGSLGKSQHLLHHTKTFYYSNGFINTDQGNHFGEVMHDEHHINTDKLVLANVTHFFFVSDLVLLHIHVSTYSSMQNKILRGANAYNYTDATDCTVVGSGKHYCSMAKHFRAQNKASYSIFMNECAQRGVQYDGSEPVRLDSFSEWFKKHSLSMGELVGDPDPE